MSQHRFNMQTVQRWFKEIDTRHCGSITQRELIIALRQRKDLQAVLCVVNSVNGGKPDDSSPEDASPDCTAGKPQLSAEAKAIKARREEVRRIKKIWDDVNSNDGDSIDWIEFVDFFRRAGLLLEYQTNSEPQARHSICRKSFLLQAQHVEAKAERQKRQRRMSELQQHHRRSLVMPRKMSEILSQKLIFGVDKMTALEEEGETSTSNDGDED